MADSQLPNSLDDLQDPELLQYLQNFLDINDFRRIDNGKPLLDLMRDDKEHPKIKSIVKKVVGLFNSPPPVAKVCSLQFLKEAVETGCYQVVVNIQKYLLPHFPGIITYRSHMTNILRGSTYFMSKITKNTGDEEMGNLMKLSNTFFRMVHQCLYVWGSLYFPGSNFDRSRLNMEEKITFPQYPSEFKFYNPTKVENFINNNQRLIQLYRSRDEAPQSTSRKSSLSKNRQLSEDKKLQRVPSPKKKNSFDTNSPRQEYSLRQSQEKVSSARRKQRQQEYQKVPQVVSTALNKMKAPPMKVIKQVHESPTPVKDEVRPVQVAKTNIKLMKMKEQEVKQDSQGGRFHVQSSQELSQIELYHEKRSQSPKTAKDTLTEAYPMKKQSSLQLVPEKKSLASPQQVLKDRNLKSKPNFFQDVKDSVIASKGIGKLKQLAQKDKNKPDKAPKKKFVSSQEQPDSIEDIQINEVSILPYEKPQGPKPNLISTKEQKHAPPKQKTKIIQRPNNKIEKLTSPEKKVEEPKPVMIQSSPLQPQSPEKAQRPKPERIKPQKLKNVSLNKSIMQSKSISVPKPIIQSKEIKGSTKTTLQKQEQADSGNESLMDLKLEESSLDEEERKSPRKSGKPQKDKDDIQEVQLVQRKKNFSPQHAKPMSAIQHLKQAQTIKQMLNLSKPIIKKQQVVDSKLPASVKEQKKEQVTINQLNESGQSLEMIQLAQAQELTSVITKPSLKSAEKLPNHQTKQTALHNVNQSEAKKKTQQVLETVETKMNKTVVQQIGLQQNNEKSQRTQKLSKKTSQQVIQTKNDKSGISAQKLSTNPPFVSQNVNSLIAQVSLSHKPQPLSREAVQLGDSIPRSHSSNNRRYFRHFKEVNLSILPVPSTPRQSRVVTSSFSPENLSSAVREQLKDGLSRLKQQIRMEHEGTISEGFSRLRDQLMSKKPEEEKVEWGTQTQVRHKAKSRFDRKKKYFGLQESSNKRQQNKPSLTNTKDALAKPPPQVELPPSQPEQMRPNTLLHALYRRHSRV